MDCRAYAGWVGSARRESVRSLQSLVMQMHTGYAGEWSSSMMQQQTCVALELCFEGMRKV